MAKGLRLSEKWFQRGLWLIAFLFAAFLIGLGSLVVADLPKVEKPLNAEQFTDHQRLAAERAELESDRDQLRDNGDALERARLELAHASAATQAERDSFRAWIATRSATQQTSENPEVLARTRALDQLRTAERSREGQVEALESRQTALEQDRDARSRSVGQLFAAGTSGYKRAVQRAELRVFGLRLLLTLPLLLLAVWLFAKRRKGPRWPFVWGFMFFALFTFFVELVPYLPSYGGYLRYLVGLALTVWGGNYAIAALRRYLERQKAAEQQPEQERRQQLSYEAAQMRLAKKICPACERPFDGTDPANNFCMNCGLLVYENCPRCNTRQTSFSHFCRACGLHRHGASSEESAPPPPPFAVDPAL